MKKKKTRARAARAAAYRHRKIRLGYLSADFGGGRTRDLLPMFFSGYNAQRFEVYAYHTGTGGDTEIFSNEVPLRELGTLSAQAAAEAIRRDGIDLLVDLSLRAPDAAARAIMALRPAPHIVSLAAGCPAELAAQLPTVAGEQVLARCCTPFVRVHRYTYRAPLRDAGVPAVGVAGACSAEGKDVLIGVLANVLPRLPAVRLLLPAAVAAQLAEDGVARVAAAGTAASVLEIVEELPYAELDLVLGTDVDFMDVCRAADHGVPLLTAAPFVYDHASAYVLTQLGCPPVRTVQEMAGAVCRLLADSAALSELHGCLHWRLSDVFDAHTILFAVERAYDRLLLRGDGRTAQELTAQITRAEAARDWAAVLSAAHALDGMERLAPEQRMSLAWAYFFLGERTYAARWALLAEGVPRDREAARLYLSVLRTEPFGTSQEIFARAQEGLALIAEGLPAVPEVRDALIKVCAEYGELAVGGETASAYARLSADAADSDDRRRFYYGISLFQLNGVDLPAAEVYRRSCGYGELFADVPRYSHRGRRNKDKIRIGYISGDFREHVMQYFIWPFFAGFDRARFEVYVYSLGKEDQYTEFFQKLVTAWRDLRPQQCDMEAIAREIYADEVDILFDLAGHTANSGLAALAWKPAPVQISGLGYMATTGLPAVDYFVTDHFCDPAGNEQFYVEKLLRLTSQFCYNGYTHLPAAQGTPARRRGYVVFATFNQYVKLQDTMLSAWREILERVPQSRLLLKNSSMGKHGCAVRLWERMRRLGFDMSRVMFEEATKDYMLRYLDVDIALDTFPWPGGGTTCDALYMGVPVVSYYTERHSTRFTYSLLANIGLAELASERMEDYVEAAVALAGNLDLLDALHRELRDRMRASPVMDQEHYIREMEAAYQMIWENYLNEEA